MSHNVIASDRTRQVMEAELSPRRKLYAWKLLQYIASRGSKALLDSRAFVAIESACNLDKAEVNQAVDDAFAAGLVSVSMCGDDAQMVTLTPFADRVGGLTAKGAT